MTHTQISVYYIADVYQSIRRQHQPYYRVYTDDGDLTTPVYFNKVFDIIESNGFDVERYIRAQFKENFIPHPRDLGTKKAINNYLSYGEEVCTSNEVSDIVEGYIDRVARVWGLDRSAAAKMVRSIL